MASYLTSAAKADSKGPHPMDHPVTPQSSVKDAHLSTGLTSEEARRRLEKFGPNAVPDTAMHPLRRALTKFWAPVPWMLEAAIVLEIVLGKYVEAAVIAALLAFNAILGFFQEGRAQATLAALKARLALNASVRRDNVWATVPATGLVPGDMVKLSVGAVVAADVRLTEGQILLDQSMLTGESVPIEAGPGFDESHVLGIAALASSDGGQDPVDAAIRSAAAQAVASDLPKLSKFVPFDSATKMSEATAVDRSGASVRVVKGAFAAVAGLAEASPDASTIANQLEAQGFRVLAVAVGPPERVKLAGIIALSDPPRPDSAAHIAELRTLGVRTVMVTGDAPATAAIVARAVGLNGAVSPPGPIPDAVHPEDFAVFAGVLPEGKYDLVKAFQKGGHTVGMCGDGANDAPALRQAQMGIAVSTATDVAKSAAGIVLTQPGLGGIVASVKEGRVTFQRILTYALNSVTKKTVQVLFLAVGLVMTGQAILTPMLMVIIMLTGDLLGMSLTADNVRPSPRPNAWRIGELTIAGVFMGISELVFCTAVLAIAKFRLGFGIETLRTLAFVTIVFGNQATTYTNRERQRLGSARPSRWLIGSSVVDVLIASTLATCGIAMTPLPIVVLGGTLVAAAVFACILDVAKVPVFKRLRIA
jgi:H+-transporting ATPase